MLRGVLIVAIVASALAALPIKTWTSQLDEVGARTTILASNKLFTIGSQKNSCYKSVSGASGYACPMSTISKSTPWYGGDRYGDLFQCTVSGNTLTVKRIDSGGRDCHGWGMNLRFYLKAASTPSPTTPPSSPPISTKFSASNGVFTSSCKCTGCDSDYTVANPAVWGIGSSKWNSNPQHGCAAACFNNQTDNELNVMGSHKNYGRDQLTNNKAFFGGVDKRYAASTGTTTGSGKKGCKFSLYDSTRKMCFLFDKGMLQVKSGGSSRFTCWATQHECMVKKNCDHYNPTANPTRTPTEVPTTLPPSKYPTTRTPTEHPTRTPTRTPTKSPVPAVSRLSLSSSTQSSEGWSGRPSRAIDGNTAQSYGSGTCTHTGNQGGNAWWKASLGSTKAVDYIKVWNRADCCASRLNGARVYIGSHQCGTLTGSSTSTVACGFKTGSYVKIQGPKDYLTLCEVHVYGKAGKATQVRGLSLSNGWAPYGHGYEAPSTTRSGDLCVVSGLIKRSGMKNPLLTLPSDCRPNKRVIFNLNNHEGTLRVDVLSNGQVHYVTGTYRHSWLNLDGIQFAVANRHTLPLRSSWRAYGGSYGTPTYTKTGSVCEIEGLLRGGSWSGHLAELPSNCRPKKRLIFNMNNHAKTCRVDISTNGRITWHAGGKDHHWVSLGGMMFSTDNGSNLPLASSWRNYGGSYGSATVAKSGNLCLVSGLVRGGHWGHAMVTLPSECRPKGRLIFNMNNHGKTARVDVLTNGQVKWIAGGRDHHWISITGITIHQH